jgi:hypothetical protein
MMPEAALRTIEASTPVRNSRSFGLVLRTHVFKLCFRFICKEILFEDVFVLPRKF